MVTVPSWSGAYRSVSDLPVSRPEVGGINCRVPNLGTSVPVREDAQAALFDRSHSLSEAFHISFNGSEPGRVARLIDSAPNLMYRTMLMIMYGTGVRRAELCHLKVAEIDSQRMVIRVRRGKGGRDRDVLLSEKLLETLRWPSLAAGRTRAASIHSIQTPQREPRPPHGYGADAPHPLRS